MGNKTQYQTKQRMELLTFLETVSGRHITVNEVCEYFKEHGKAIGMTTVYRQLERMVDEGLVMKYNIDGKTSTCFEYVGEDSHVHSKVCYHCKCEVCGCLFHLQCSELPVVQKHIQEHHGFAIDPIRTVFYGICEKCSGTVQF